MTIYCSSIPESPSQGPSPMVGEALAAARTYLEHADRLRYSYGSRTFLSGYDLFDPASGRGYIDCSTFLLLVLAGIPYEESPYARGTAEGLSVKPVPWAERELADLSRLPRSYVGIAERIGRPYLAGPKGLDLAKAEAMGISVETLGEEIRASGAVRRSVQIARFYLEKGRCFSDPAYLHPGDLAFYLSSGFFSEGERRYPAAADVSHVGIVSEDPSQMINSAGARSGTAGREPAGVVLSPVFGKRTPAFFARPGYGMASQGAGAGRDGR